VVHSHEWAPLRWLLLLVVLAFTATFPLRIFHGVLQGAGSVLPRERQLAGWTAGTITIVGVMAGLGLYSLALGWIAGQALPAVLAWRRAARGSRARCRRASSARASRHGRAVRPRRLDQRVAGRQVLLNGTDLVVIGMLLGPEAVVPCAHAESW
jgi:hypothetical protein